MMLGWRVKGSEMLLRQSRLSLPLFDEVSPKIFNISAVGFVGFVLAGVLTIRLIYSIIKSGKI